MNKTRWISSRATFWAACLVVLSCSAFAHGQDEEANNGDPIPLPFTRDALKVMYKKGLLIRYMKTTHRANKPPVQQLILNEVVDHSSKGYLVRTLVFNESGSAVGKPTKPQAIPYTVESRTFRAAKAYKYERILVGKDEYSAHKYNYKVQLGGRPGWRSVWYSGKHRGLLLKTMERPIGEFGKKNFTTLEIQGTPAALGGPKETIGAPQGNLPWTDAEIFKAWPQGSYAEFELKTKSKESSETLRFRQTMLGREPTCFVLREQLWGEKGELRGDTGRPKLWASWLKLVRMAPGRVLEKKLDREVEAAGRKWPCKVYSLKKGEQTITWFLSKEIPGLTVQYTSVREGMKVTRTLSSLTLPLPK